MTTRPTVVPKGARTALERRGRIAVLGAVHESLPMLQALLGDSRVEVVAVVTPSSISRPSGAVDLASVARRCGVPAFEGLELKSPEGLAILALCEIDLMVVVGWTRLVPEPVLALPTFGCVGFHASLLPRHRGRAPVNWAIIRGESRTGATMLMLDAGVDTGPVVDQRPIDIGLHDTCGTVYERVAAAGVEMMLEHLPALLAGRAPRHVQLSGSGGDVLPKRTPDMGITDWARPSLDVHNWIRALTHPYPGAFSFFGGRTVRFWRAEPGPASSGASQMRPGAVIGCADGGVLVAAGQGMVRLLVVEENAGEMPASLWFERAGRPIGMTFDPVDAATSRWALGRGPAPEKLPAAAALRAVAG